MSDEILKQVGEWCAAADDLSIEGSTVTVAGDPPIGIDLEVGDDAVTLSHTHTAAATPEGFGEQASALLGGRGSMLGGSVSTEDDATRIDLGYPIYLDGLNRQTILLAIRDITAAADGLAALASASVPGEDPAPEEAAAETEPEPVDTPVAEEPIEADTFEAEAEPTVVSETVVVDPAGTWTPTHTVPGGGLSAWAEPDPGLAPVAKLSARVELRVDEQRGAWARVTGSNGWTGWVDARKLRPLGAAAPQGASPAAPGRRRAPAGTGEGLGMRPIPLLAGVLMIVSAFIPWNATGTALDGTYVIPVGKPMDWPAAFLANRLDPGQPRIGLVVLILGIVLIGAALMPRLPMAALVGIGLAALLIAVLFLFQFSRAPGWGDTFKILEAGFWIYLVAAIGASLPIRLQV